MTDNPIRYLIDDAHLAELAGQCSTPLLLAISAVCLVVLLKGADWAVDGVVHLAHRTGMPRLVIGATLVSLGTTAPEAAVSVMAALMGNPDLALGNGVGSIIADTGLIFGLTCLLARVPVNRFILDRTGWVQTGSATLLVVVCMVLLVVGEGTPVLGRWFGWLMLLLLVGYLAASYIWAQHGHAAQGEADFDGKHQSIVHSLSLLALGLILVVGAARVLIPCVSEIALRMGVPSDIVAATLVAFGTSLPELTTAITAVRRGYPEITVGNIVGADVLNCLFVIGASAAAEPLLVSRNFYLVHFPAMLLILYSFRGFIAWNRGGYFRRWQGAWLIALYAAYLLVLYGLNLGQPLE
jgi:cation:H+ antiporter